MIVSAGGGGGRNLTADVDEFDAKDIEQWGGRTVGDLLHHVRGAFVRTGGEGESLIRLRGYRQREVKVMVDGVPMDAPYSGRQDLRQLPASQIAKVRVVKGGASVLYGPNSVGGVVEIITRKPGDKPGATLTGEVGADDYWRGTLSLGAPFGNAYAGMYLDATDRDGFPLSHGFHSDPQESGGTRGNSDFEQVSGALTAGYEDEDSSVGLSVSHWGAEYGIPWQLAPANAKFVRVEDVDRTRVAAAFEQKLSQTATGKLALHLNRGETLTARYDDASMTTQAARRSFTEDATDQNGGAIASLALDFEEGASLGLAYGVQHSRRRASGFEVTRAGSSDIDLDKHIWLHYLAAEQQVRVGDDLTVLGGLRCDEWHGPERERSWNWNVGLSWDVGEAVTVTPSFYRRTQFPMLRELFATDSGNEDLDPERMTGGALTVEWRLPKGAEAALSLFHERISDLIDKDANGVYQNIDEARHQGIEIGTSVPLAEQVAASVDYTYLDAEDRSGGIANPHLRYRPRHKVDSRLTWESRRGLTASVYHTYTGAQYVSEDNRDTVRASNVFGMAASQRIGDHARLFAKVDNIFDYNYHTSLGLPAEGRSALAGVELEY